MENKTVEVSLTKKELKKLYNKRYYEKTKENNLYNCRKTPQKCEVCNGSYQYYNKSRHLKRPKHVKALNKLNSSN